MWRWIKVVAPFPWRGWSRATITIWLGVGVMACSAAHSPAEHAADEAPPLVVVTPTDPASVPAEQPPEQKPPQKMASAPQKGPAVVGQPAPAVGGTLVSGSGLDTIEEARGRVVIVDFWATFCMPCQRTIPYYQQLVDRYGGDVVVIGVSVDDPDDSSAQDIDGFFRQHGGKYAALFDDGQRTAERYEPPKLPSSYIIDRAGIVRYIHGGYSGGDATQINKEIEALVGEQ